MSSIMLRYMFWRWEEMRPDERVYCWIRSTARWATPVIPPSSLAVKSRCTASGSSANFSRRTVSSTVRVPSRVVVIPMRASLSRPPPVQSEPTGSVRAERTRETSWIKAGVALDTASLANFSWEKV